MADGEPMARPVFDRAVEGNPRVAKPLEEVGDLCFLGQRDDEVVVEPHDRLRVLRRERRQPQGGSSGVVQSLQGSA